MPHPSLGTVRSSCYLANVVFPHHRCFLLWRKELLPGIWRLLCVLQSPCEMKSSASERGQRSPGNKKGITAVSTRMTMGPHSHSLCYVAGRLISNSGKRKRSNGPECWAGRWEGGGEGVANQESRVFFTALPLSSVSWFACLSNVHSYLSTGALTFRIGKNHKCRFWLWIKVAVTGVKHNRGKRRLSQPMSLLMCASSWGRTNPYMPYAMSDGNDPSKWTSRRQGDCSAQGLTSYKLTFSRDGLIFEQVETEHLPSVQTDTG